MNHTVIPAGYEPALSLYETQAAISLIKRTFQDRRSGLRPQRRPQRRRAPGLL